jgi:signal transduction histidine kinase
VTWRGRLLAASPWRALAEAGLATLGLGLPLLVIIAGAPDMQGRVAARDLGAFYIGCLGALVAAGRLRRAGGSRRRQLGYEAACAALAWLTVVAAALAAGAAAALLAPTGVTYLPPWLGQSAVQFDRVGAAAMVGVGGAAGALTYPVLRAAAVAWPVWDRLRRTRLLWALTHAQFVVVAALALALAAVAAACALFAADDSGFAPADAGGAALLARLVVFFLPAATALLVVGAAASAVLLPLFALISFPVLRRATRRLEELATATGVLRAGDLAARVPVAGEDEVARLQADFNAMADDLERAMRDLQAERDTVARLLQARRELVAAVSHELRTPVATLRGYLDSALDHWDAAPPATLRADLAVMAQETERLGRLIDDLFTLARAEVGALPLAVRPTDVGELLRRGAAAVAPLAWERARVEVLAEAPADLPPALADPDRLEQVIRNLTTNAVRHTPPGGLALLTAAAEDGAIVVQVKDTGEGIAPEDLPRVFERFYRADAARDRDRGGAGLGLALAKELTEAMGGSVAVASVVGEGSVFTLRLPAA